MSSYDGPTTLYSTDPAGYDAVLDPISYPDDICPTCGCEDCRDSGGCMDDGGWPEEVFVGVESGMDEFSE